MNASPTGLSASGISPVIALARVPRVAAQSSEGAEISFRRIDLEPLR